MRENVERGRAGPPAAQHRRWAADEALTELYAAHWDSLVRLAWLLLRDQHVAEEVVQDAFVAMHAPLVAAARARAARWPTCGAAVVNTSRSVLRHRGVEDRYLVSGAATARTAHGIDHRAQRRGARPPVRATGDRMIRALGRLPRRQREVLTLRYYADLSEAQIADALGISAGSVKAHASRGLAALRHDGEITS